MQVGTLDYASRDEFDTGRFVARYLQVLACLSVASMVAGALFFDSLHVDPSFVFLFWAAAGLKRRSRATRNWVLVICGLSLGVGLLMVLVAGVFGTQGMTVSFGRERLKNPAFWQVLLVAVPFLVVVGMPFLVLASKRARRQFEDEPAGGHAMARK